LAFMAYNATIDGFTMHKIKIYIILFIFSFCLALASEYRPLATGIRGFTDTNQAPSNVYTSDSGHKLVRDSNGYLHAVFMNFKSSGNTYEIIYARSPDGYTWSSKVVTTRAGQFQYARSPAIAVSGNTVYIVYTDSVDGGTNRGLNLLRDTLYNLPDWSQHIHAVLVVRSTHTPSGVAMNEISRTFSG